MPSDAADAGNQPLTLIGRLSRQEEISFSLHLLTKYRTKRYVYSSLLVPAVAFVALHAARPALPLLWHLELFVAAFFVGVLIRFLVAVLRIFITTKNQQQDTTLIFDQNTVTVDNRTRKFSVQIAAVKLETLPDCFAGYHEGYPVFVLPFRALSLDQRSQIERLFGAA